MAPIARTFGIEEFTAQSEANGIAASVVVQTVTEVAETEELLDLAAATAHLAGVVGWVDLAAADVGEQLDRLAGEAVRAVARRDPQPRAVRA